MNAVPTSTPASLDQLLAQNLTAARVGTRTTQQDLAEFSRISRATIAQIESGSSDPRISTLERLAGALNLPVFLLLASPTELAALAQLAGHQLPQSPTPPPAEHTRKIARLTSTGVPKDRLRATRISAELTAYAGDASARAAAIAAVFTPFANGTAEPDPQQPILAALLLADLLREKRT